jgi:hypothetical protein
MLENLAVRADGSVQVVAAPQREVWYVPTPSEGLPVEPILLHKPSSRADKNGASNQRCDRSSTNENAHRSRCAVSGPADSGARDRSSTELKPAPPLTE